MKNNFKINSIIIALAVCMLATGCGNTADSSENSGKDSTTSKSVTTEVTTQADDSSVTESTTTTTTKSDDSETETTTAKKPKENNEAIAAEKSNTEADTDTSSKESSGVSVKSKDSSAQSSSDKTQSKETSSSESTTVASSGQTAKAVTASYTASSGGKLDTADIFSNRDLSQTADTTEAKAVTVSDGKTIEITEAGVYIISGTAKNCTIKVNAGDEDKVQLVLDGVSITNEDFPAIYVVNADKTFITTADGASNTLSVTGTFTADGDTNTDAVIYSKDDLVLNGLGTLTVQSTSGNGITCKDDLKATGGTYSITSKLDAIEVNDSILICGGDFTINSSKDGLHCENSDDNTLGYIYIAGGTFNIKASGDGIQGTTVVQIDDGTFTINASEGIESTYIQINGGDITITSNDDGINASNKSSAESVAFEMTGGNLNITMSGNDVDCIDANGKVIVSGGTIDLTYPEQGPSESFDYDGTATYTGGTIIINGQQTNSIPTPMMMGSGGMGGFGGNGGRGGRRI